MTETMTVHKGLCELKILNNRIYDAINSASFVATNKHSSSKINGKDVELFISEAKDAYKSIVSLINRRNALKAAITQSNAVTTIKINGKDYTVAQAIDMKSTATEYLKNLLGRIESQYDACAKKADKDNNALEEKADRYVKDLYEAKDVKNLSEESKKSREIYVEANTVELVDPIDAVKVMKKLKDEIDAFTSEVDSALSVSNAVTEITFDYETK